MKIYCGITFVIPQFKIV